MGGAQDLTQRASTGMNLLSQNHRRVELGVALKKGPLRVMHPARGHTASTEMKPLVIIRFVLRGLGPEKKSHEAEMEIKVQQKEAASALHTCGKSLKDV